MIDEPAHWPTRRRARRRPQRWFRIAAGAGMPLVGVLGALALAGERPGRRPRSPGGLPTAADSAEVGGTSTTMVHASTASQTLTTSVPATTTTGDGLGAVMGDVVGGRGGVVVAVFQMAGDLGAVIGPVAAGWIADAHGYSATFVVCALVSLLPIPAVLAARETLIREPARVG